MKIRVSAVCLCLVALAACESKPAEQAPQPTQPVQPTSTQQVPSVSAAHGGEQAKLDDAKAEAEESPAATTPEAPKAEDAFVPAVSDPKSAADGDSTNGPPPSGAAEKKKAKVISNLLGVGSGEGGLGISARGSIGGLGSVGYGRGGGGALRDTGGGKGMGGKIGPAYVGRGHYMNQGPPRPVAEPQLSNTEAYKNYGTNSWTDTAKDKLSTFAADVDTGSYTIARRKLEEGVIPPAASVRVEEFVNYFSYNYPNPDSGAFGVNLEAAPSPFVSEKDRYLVRVGVQGKRISAKQRKPVHLTFLVDVSGSMSQSDKLPLAKQALKVLTNNLKPGDTVALATYAGHTATVLKPTGMENKGQILSAIDSLGAGGGTGMSSGMEAAYKLALSTHRTGDVNRVIVLSDGDANIGPSSHEQILKDIKKYVDEGVTLSTIGFGMGNYKDTLMEQLANKGNGNYYYIDSVAEARKVFGEQLDGTLQVIAKDVKLQVEFNPKAVKQYRLIGYENRDIRDQDFRDDKVDAGEIGAGHTVTAMYEVILQPEHQERQLAIVRVRHKEPEAHTASEQTFNLSAQELRTKLSDASSDFQFAAAVTAFAEILRKSPHAKDLSFSLVEEVARAASSANQKDRQEFLSLVKKAQALDKRS